MYREQALLHCRICVCVQWIVFRSIRTIFPSYIRSSALPAAPSPPTTAAVGANNDKSTPTSSPADDDINTGDVPNELQVRLQDEEMFFARKKMIMRVVRVSGDQLGYCGHVFNVAQDVFEFAHKLS